MIGSAGRASRASISIGIAVLLLASLASARPGAANASSPRPLRTGISYSYSSDPLAFQHVKATGSQLVQIPLRWAQVAPAIQPANWNPEDPADPNYDWESLDLWATQAVRAGLTPVIQIRSAPRWAERCTPNFSDATCNPDPNALAAFAKAAVRRYSGSFDGLPRIRYWQGLNEPNLALFFEPQYESGELASPALYRTLINSFYAAVKSVEPSDLVLSAGLGPIAAPGYTVGPMQFARSLLCMGGGRHPHPVTGDCGGGVHFDIFDIHPYTTGGPTHKGGPNDVELGDLSKLQNLLSAADKAGRIKGAFARTPLWITEFAWDSKPPDPGGLPMKIASQWVPEALHEAWRAGVSNFMWFTLVDSPPEPEVPFSESLQSGLYFWAPSIAAQRPKQEMYAFRFPFIAIRHGNGLRFWGRTPTSRHGKVTLQALEGGRWRTVGVTKADSVGIFRGSLRIAYGSDRKGEVRARFSGQSSLGFPMHRVGDFVQPPFG